MGKNGLLTVSQFSKLIKQTPQAVYKQFNNKLKDYVVTVDGKKMVKPEAVTDEGMVLIAHEMALKIQNEVRYPGQIKINVIRESRATDYAK